MYIYLIYIGNRLDSCWDSFEKAQDESKRHYEDRKKHFKEEEIPLLEPISINSMKMNSGDFACICPNFARTQVLIDFESSEN